MFCCSASFVDTFRIPAQRVSIGPKIVGSKLTVDTVRDYPLLVLVAGTVYLGATGAEAPSLSETKS